MPDLRVIFDLDDTLYPERSFAVSAFEEVGRWAKAELGVDGLHHDMTRLLDDGHLGQLFKLVLQERSLDLEHSSRLIEIYRNHRPEQLHLYHDAAAALDDASARGAIGLITDGTVAVQRSKVQALGIGHRFGHIVYTHDRGREFAKPHASSFESMAAVLGQPGDRFVYVGDNPSKDFIAPNAMGWVTVQVQRPQRIHAAAQATDGGHPHYIIDSLSELPALIRG